jgi:hypothetical protein
MTQLDEPVFDSRLLQRLYRPLAGPGVHRALLADNIFARVERMSTRSALVERLTRQVEFMRAEDGELPLVVSPRTEVASASASRASVPVPTSHRSASGGVIQAKAVPGGLLANASLAPPVVTAATPASAPAESSRSSSFGPTSSTDGLVDAVASAMVASTVEAVVRAEAGSRGPLAGAETMLVSPVDRSSRDSAGRQGRPVETATSSPEGAESRPALTHARASQDQRAFESIALASRPGTGADLASRPGTRADLASRPGAELARVSPKRTSILEVVEQLSREAAVDAPTLILHDARIVLRGPTDAPPPTLASEGEVARLVFAQPVARWRTLRETPVVRTPAPGPAHPVAHEARRRSGPSVIQVRPEPQRGITDSSAAPLELQAGASSGARESSAAPRSSARSFTSEVSAAARSASTQPQMAQPPIAQQELAQPAVARAPARSTAQLDEDALAQRVERKILHRWMLERERRGIF